MYVAKPSTFNLITVDTKTKKIMRWFSFVKTRQIDDDPVNNKITYNLIATYTFENTDDDEIVPSCDNRTVTGLDPESILISLYTDRDNVGRYICLKPITWIVQQKFPPGVSLSPRWKYILLHQFNKYLSFSNYTFMLIYMYVCCFDIDMPLTEEDWRVYENITCDITKIGLVSREFCVELLSRIEKKILTG